MKSSWPRRSKTPHRGVRKPLDARAEGNQSVRTEGAPVKPLALRERDAGTREHSARRRQRSSGEPEAAIPRDHPAQTRAEVDRLMGQLREANQRLIVAAVQAQDHSDEAHLEATQAKTELEHLMNQLREANQRLTTAAAHAETLAEEARQREEEYRHLSVRLLQLQDEERRRLAVDLHDSTAQSLAALTMNLHLVNEAKLDNRSHRALVESQSLAEQCVREVRTLSYLLHPPFLEEAGLLSAVRWFAEGFGKRSGIQVILDLEEIGRLDAPIETALFRVVQECLTNVHRHASARTASIRLKSSNGAIVLDIQDQGRGLRDGLTRQDGSVPPETLGVGIRGMRERIRQLGGTFHIEFTAEGTKVCVSVPVGKDSTEPVRILIADDHEVVRRGVRALLESQAGWVVCGETGNGHEAVAMAVDLRPDVVILDISMPELSGLDASRQIQRTVPAKVLVLTVHESEQVKTEVLQAGAQGYVLKSDAGRKLVDAVRALLGHQEFFPEHAEVTTDRRRRPLAQSAAGGRRRVRR
jgi:signal transduction histidine kinase/CheY-like chemotaxis protein